VNVNVTSPIRPQKLFNENSYSPFTSSDNNRNKSEEDELETPRIDVKKDIAINEGIKVTSKSFSESRSQIASDSKLSFSKQESR
jgi:hypothetical protein